MTRIISLVLVALATWTLGCAGDSSATTPSQTDAYTYSDAKVPPGADSPYPPEDVSTNVEDDTYTPEPKADTNTDPCAAYREWIQEGVTYMCVYACGGEGPCTPTFTSEGGCAVQCDPNFYEFAGRLKRTGINQFIYNPPDADCAATCTPVQ